jgi:E3 ubiquitin-protein ligase HERC3
VKCWGLNQAAQLGQGTLANVGAGANDMQNLQPINLAGVAVRAIAAGNEHACALLLDGNVKCWGRNNVGQLGLGVSSTTELIGDAPSEMGANLGRALINTASDVVALRSGQGNFTCALTANDDVYCWGGNGFGQLGLGTTDAFNATPTLVPVVDISD